MPSTKVCVLLFLFLFFSSPFACHSFSIGALFLPSTKGIPSLFQLLVYIDTMRILLPLFCVAVIFISCSDDTPPPYTPPYSYTVLPLKKSDTTITVSIFIKDQSGDSITFLLPPIYADNPLLVPLSPPVVDISVTKTYGESVAYTLGSQYFDQFTIQTITFANSDSIHTLTYEVYPHFPDTSILAPSIAPSGGYMQGNYLFALPYNNEDLGDLWRLPNNYDVNYHLPPNATLFGDPAKGWSGKSFYQLLFSSSLLNAKLLTSGTVGDQHYSIVSPIESTFPNIPAAKTAFEGIMATLHKSFTPFSTQPISIFFDLNRSGGLEGTFAFSIQSDLYTTASPSIFNMILAHEAVHWWIGVYMGDIDDPWWKEGTTNYLGYLFSGRAGFTLYSDIANELLYDYSSDPIIAATPLSDPSLRYTLYNDLENLTYYRLVYGKGAQVSMMLDAEIRSFTLGETRLEDALALLTKRHWKSAFSRQEYLSAIEEVSGYDATVFFATYVDASGVIPAPLLESALATITKYEKFNATASLQKTRATAPKTPWYIRYH